MKHEVLSEALNQISDRHILQSSVQKRHFPWVKAIAAILAFAILTGAATLGFIQNRNPNTGNFVVPTWAPPVPGEVHLLSSPVLPELVPFDNGRSDLSAYDAWWKSQRTQHDQPDGYADTLTDYFLESIPAMLAGGNGQNVTCSPLNIYMALAMLAETTSGNSQKQLLNLMNAKNIQSLRTQAENVWNAHYNDDGLTTSILGASLWLTDGYSYNETIVHTLAESYYASVYQGALGSDSMNKALQAWLKENTGGLLDEQAEKVKLSPDSSMAIATTLFYQVQWMEKFFAEQNTQAIFHGTSTDTETTFMNKRLLWSPYFWGEDFGAVSLSLEDNSQMWLFLPDEGITPEQLLKSGHALTFALDTPNDEKNSKSVIINLSVPKFDISWEANLIPALKNLGVTDIFDSSTADFSNFIRHSDGIASNDGGWIDTVTHANRVAINEEGVTAAAFTVIDRCGAAMPPDEEIDFVLDRPFLFAIVSSDGLPLFTGIVNQP